jgi:hypothetical protein
MCWWNIQGTNTFLVDCINHVKRILLRTNNMTNIVYTHYFVYILWFKKKNVRSITKNHLANRACFSILKDVEMVIYSRCLFIVNVSFPLGTIVHLFLFLLSWLNKRGITLRKYRGLEERRSFQRVGRWEGNL